MARGTIILLRFSRLLTYTTVGPELSGRPQYHPAVHVINLDDGDCWVVGEDLGFQGSCHWGQGLVYQASKLQVNYE